MLSISNTVTANIHCQEIVKKKKVHSNTYRDKNLCLVSKSHENQNKTIALVRNETNNLNKLIWHQQNCL